MRYEAEDDENISFNLIPDPGLRKASGVSVSRGKTSLRAGVSREGLGLCLGATRVALGWC